MSFATNRGALNFPFTWHSLGSKLALIILWIMRRTKRVHSLVEGRTGHFYLQLIHSGMNSGISFHGNRISLRLWRMIAAWPLYVLHRGEVVLLNLAICLSLDIIQKVLFVGLITICPWWSRRPQQETCFAGMRQKGLLFNISSTCGIVGAVFLNVSNQ